MPKPRDGMLPKGKVKKGTVKRLLKYIAKSYKIAMIVVLICIILSALANVAGSVFWETLIDDYITPLLMIDNPSFGGLIKAILTMASIYAAGIICTLTYSLIMVKVSQGTLRNVREDMFSHMQKLPIRFFDTNSDGDIMSYYTNDTDTLRQMISQSIPGMLSSAVTLIGVLAAMIYMSWKLTLIILAMMVIMMLIIKLIGGKSAKYFVLQQQSLGKENGYIEEMINGQKVIKVFCHETETKSQFDDMNEELFKNSDKANKYANILMPVLMNVGNIQYVLLAIIGGILIIKGSGAMTVGALVSFLTLSRTFTNNLSQVSQQINAVAAAMAGASRIFDFLDKEEEQDNGYVTLVNAKEDENGNTVECTEHTGIWAWKHPHHDGTMTYTKLKGKIEMSDVDFGYTPEKIVLHDVSVYANPGQKVALVGATGAGKTTITNLLNRFYDIADGKIRYDGININKIKKQDLRRSMGMVLQNTNLFTGTVMDNIKYGNLKASDDKCIEAAKLANADGFIRRLPDGYDTVITGNGANLSQGQRQLISIARAAVADPPVMILDEATSSIDTHTEHLIQNGMDSLMEGRTVFVIAHRLSTIQNSDLIMVLDMGRIIEKGTHDELIAEKGRYYQLYTGAFELE